MQCGARCAPGGGGRAWGGSGAGGMHEEGPTQTAGKVATDEHTFDLFVEEQALRLDEGMCTRRQGRCKIRSYL